MGFRGLWMAGVQVFLAVLPLMCFMSFVDQEHRT